MAGWKIKWKGPTGEVRGRALPMFIRNGPHYLSTIKVYADGVIDCWGGIDLDLFRRGKLGGPPISPRPPVGSQISIDLGHATVAEAEWSLSLEEVHAQVEESIRELNPSMQGLIDLHGEDCEVRGGVRTAKIGIRREWPYRTEADGAEIRGDEVPVFVSKPSGFQLTRWFVYADGSCQVSYESPPMPIQKAIQMMEGGELSTSVPDGAWVDVEGVGRFRVGKGDWWVKPYERIRECLDLVEIARGQPGSILTCVKRHEEYESDPSPDRREALRQAYEAVPEHLQMYCGNMDSKDWPIRRILYGGREEE